MKLFGKNETFWAAKSFKKFQKFHHAKNVTKMLLPYLLRWFWLWNYKGYKHLQKPGGGFEESTIRRPW